MATVEAKWGFSIILNLWTSFSWILMCSSKLCVCTALMSSVIASYVLMYSGMLKISIVTSVHASLVNLPSSSSFSYLSSSSPLTHFFLLLLLPSFSFLFSVFPPPPPSLFSLLSSPLSKGCYTASRKKRVVELYWSHCIMELIRIAPVNDRCLEASSQGH